MNEFPVREVSVLVAVNDFLPKVNEKNAIEKFFSKQTDSLLDCERRTWETVRKFGFQIREPKLVISLSMFVQNFPNQCKQPVAEKVKNIFFRRLLHFNLPGNKNIAHKCRNWRFKRGQKLCKLKWETRNVKATNGFFDVVRSFAENEKTGACNTKMHVPYHDLRDSLLN